jgi:hypothetical protein
VRAEGLSRAALSLEQPSLARSLALTRAPARTRVPAASTRSRVHGTFPHKGVGECRSPSRSAWVPPFTMRKEGLQSSRRKDFTFASRITCTPSPYHRVVPDPAAERSVFLVT